MKSENTIPIWQKFALTIPEAVDYFGIGEKKLRKMISDNQDADYILMNGSKALVKRRLFETFLEGTSAI